MKSIRLNADFWNEKYLNNNRFQGIDRIVPVGSSTEMGLYWDGYDLKHVLTKVTDIV